MHTAKNDGLGGRGITYTPTTGQYKNVVVWMHGLGDTADGWASMMPSLGLKNTKFILPTAPVRGISLNGGQSMPGWSDIFGLDMGDPEDKNGFDESAERINEIVKKEIDNGIPSTKIVLAGFSQGGAVALHAALRSTVPLGGCVALSTWLPFRAEYPEKFSEAAKNLPILQVHGDRDQVVGHRWGKGSHQLLTQLITSPTPKFETIQGMGHSSDEDETVMVSSFLTQIFRDDA